MLTMQKQDIMKYLKDRNLKWYEDISNNERKYTRNKIRLDVIPTMEDIAGGKQSLQR